MGEQAVVRAPAALVDGDVDLARREVAGGGSRLERALAEHLRADGHGSVYDRPAAFEAFIRGGGNVALYAAVGTALADLYDRFRPAALLDVGCGDGTALLPALQAARHHPAHLDLLEPSAPLLGAALERLRQRAGSDPRTQVHAHPVTAQAFTTGLAAQPDPARTWDLVQSTFALHAIDHDQRAAVLRDLRPHVARLAVVEFDVPDVAVGSPDHLRFLHRTYEQGLAEYSDDRDLVAQGFLMPVLTGQLRPGAVRATFEQPATAWARQLQRAGWTDVTTRPLHDYWSSPAFLVTARGGVGTSGGSAGSSHAARAGMNTA
ncbi:methyltransferase [Jannaschia sp. R86511]|uniref:methyltransferase n=1 Tax=Jannaschia sp. R86511 TaxID=3093853 RepID=UPI0036D34574